MKTKAHLKSEAFTKKVDTEEVGKQWTDAFSTEVVTYFPDTILTPDYRVPTVIDQSQ
jgi:hypothetical protein